MRRQSFVAIRSYLTSPIILITPIFLIIILTPIASLMHILELPNVTLRKRVDQSPRTFPIWGDALTTELSGLDSRVGISYIPRMNWIPLCVGRLYSTTGADTQVKAEVLTIVKWLILSPLNSTMTLWWEARHSCALQPIPIISCTKPLELIHSDLHGPLPVAMLYEVQLPPSFWGEALTAQIHVWNRIPTSSLKCMTPHEAWFKRKPNISHLYVYVQKDKRRSLQPHMEKCVFVGVLQPNHSEV